MLLRGSEKLIELVASLELYLKVYFHLFGRQTGKKKTLTCDSIVNIKTTLTYVKHEDIIHHIQHNPSVQQTLY